MKWKAHDFSLLRDGPSVTFNPLDPVATVNVRHGCVRCRRGWESMAKAKLKILYGEGDGDVLAQQAAAFEKAGHSVQKAEGRKGVDAALKTAKFDLVILGSSLSRNDRHHLPYMVKKANAETQVLVMHADGSRHPYVDACTDTGSSMEHVVNRIDAMNIAGSKPAAAAAGAGR